MGPRTRLGFTILFFSSQLRHGWERKSFEFLGLNGKYEWGDHHTGIEDEMGIVFFHEIPTCALGFGFGCAVDVKGPAEVFSVGVGVFDQVHVFFVPSVGIHVECHIGPRVRSGDGR